MNTNRRLAELEKMLKEHEVDLILYQNPETRNFILMDINAIKFQIKEMAKDRSGAFQGSHKWNRGSRNRSDSAEAEDWAWHDKD